MSDLNHLMSLIQNSQKTLFILCGFPYAGKSYIAKRLLEHADVVFVSIDDIFHACGFDWNTNTLPSSDEFLMNPIQSRKMRSKRVKMCCTIRRIKRLQVGINSAR